MFSIVASERRNADRPSYDSSAAKMLLDIGLEGRTEILNDKTSACARHEDRWGGEKPETRWQDEMLLEETHVTVSMAYSSPILTPPWNTIAPGFAAITLRTRRHFCSVDGSLPEVLRARRTGRTEMNS